VVQPLFDLANPASDLSKQMEEQSRRINSSGGGGQEKTSKPPLQVSFQTSDH